MMQCSGQDWVLEKKETLTKIIIIMKFKQSLEFNSNMLVVN